MTHFPPNEERAAHECKDENEDDVDENSTRVLSLSLRIGNDGRTDGRTDGLTDGGTDGQLVA